MGIVQTINLIQTVNATISGVRKAPQVAQYPVKADTPDLPLVLTVPAAGQWHHSGIGGALKRMDRVYRIVCFLEPLGQNELPARFQDSMNLLQAFVDMWLTPTGTTGYPIALADPVNAGDPQVTIADGNPHSDTGLRRDLRMGNVLYMGFTIDLRVRELW